MSVDVITQKKKARANAGQTMVEFLLVMMVIFTLLFAFLQLAWVLAWGHYVHYSTFMAARAYMSAHATQAQQAENAALVLRSMLKSNATGNDLLGQIAPAVVGDRREIGSGPEPVPGGFIGTHPFAAGQDMRTRAFSWAEGVQYNFEFKLFFVPFAKWLDGDIGKKITVGPRGEERSIDWNGRIGLASDAFLGREQSDEECRLYMQELSRVYRRGDGEEFLYDNGC
jgi:hypothetical protein